MSLFAFDDAACEAFAREGTPLFAYSLGTAEAQFRALRAALPPRARLAYAVKANPHPRLLERFADLGASFDCASAGELARVADLAPGRIFYAGPGKRTAELDLALGLGVRVQAEGWEDLERLERLAKGPVAVNLRVHPGGGIREASPIIGGTGPSAFGVDEEDLPALLARAAGLRKVAIRGLHVFAASNERDATRLLATHRHVLGMARRLQEALVTPLEQVDLGGGLGIPYAPGEAPLDVEALGRGLGELLEQSPWFTGELVLEPGRFLAGPCGVYLTRVTRVKESRGVRFVILEGGVNHLLRPLLTGQAFPTRAVGAAGPVRPATLAGPLCTSLDRLGEVELPELAPGALLALGMAGAYGFTEAMTPFLSHPAPRERWEA
ncbi:alanine racemase [Mesoterricola silvestris]|uniref:Diaminopimelate decarboxylase n=1 Tax=Mesoterricola silvestris TaxID=2927979 RepID=A0AA48K7Y2_9BACT|nr:alanine racemase [Mesoterricola silvestris]BDU71646.1 diaminopimelate decarboxylase [Mesoterricola silvestris]